MEKTTCKVCFHECELSENMTGFCHARKNINNEIIPVNYGKITSMALDPIEKKPLSNYMPGSMILSIGSFGCNFRCPFCQNSEISMTYFDEKNNRVIYKDVDTNSYIIPYRELSPEEISNFAIEYKSKGNIGVAYTYNEPLISYEFVRDTAKLIHEKNMKNVVVTNGSIKENILLEILPYIDAINIDLKSFNSEFYSKYIKGNLEDVKNFIRISSESCHIEITTLIIPGKNDSIDEMREIAKFISSLKNGRNIAFHLSRFFPRYKETDTYMTSAEELYKLRDVAREYLDNVIIGNV